METHFYAQLARTEDHHWWFRARCNSVARQLNSMELPDQCRILDVGCGTGGTTRFLQKFGRVTGIDKSPEALSHARRKATDANLIQADVNNLDTICQPGSFDLVTFFNVLYHQWIPNDVDMLAKVRRVLAPGGYVLLTEAAFPSLTRRHDSVGQGKKRYHLSDMKHYFREVGLMYRGGRYFNCALFPVCLALAAIDRVAGKRAPQQEDLGELATPPNWLNRLLQMYLDAENRVTDWLPIPFGVTLLAVGRKPTSDVASPCAVRQQTTARRSA